MNDPRHKVVGSAPTMLDAADVTFVELAIQHYQLFIRAMDRVPTEEQRVARLEFKKQVFRAEHLLQRMKQP